MYKFKWYHFVPECADKPPQPIGRTLGEFPDIVEYSYLGKVPWCRVSLSINLVLSLPVFPMSLSL
jgi:hypothetical protein